MAARQPKAFAPIAAPRCSESANLHKPAGSIMVAESPSMKVGGLDWGYNTMDNEEFIANKEKRK